MSARNNGSSRKPSLEKGDIITLGSHAVLVDQFLRWGPLLPDVHIEIYRAALTLPVQQDPTINFKTLHKIPNTSESVVKAAQQELDLLASIHGSFLRLVPSIHRDPSFHVYLQKLIRHPHIACPIDSGIRQSLASPLEKSQSRYDVYYLFEHEETDTLADVLTTRRQNDGKISEPELLEIIFPVCEAVAFMHTFSPPLLHRNIRLSNVVMTGNEKLLLSGFFGVALEIAPDIMREEDLPRLIDDLACYATSHYTAPEARNPTTSAGVTTKSGRHYPLSSCPWSN
ncbi:hypothetical protein FRC00_002938 [Tulasnella sp. 408]|nr:hypothetical protein FRC00_002938 [Tulasnella sp. 408]